MSLPGPEKSGPYSRSDIMIGPSTGWPVTSGRRGIWEAGNSGRKVNWVLLLKNYQNYFHSILLKQICAFTLKLKFVSKLIQINFSFLE